MSTFGGDSWAREAQQRKRRLDDFLLSSSPSSSYKKLANGKYACLVCPNKPILDSPLAISMHNKGYRHIASETRLKERELSTREELNKRIALANVADNTSKSVTSTQQSNHSEIHKPLIEQTRQAILETLSNRSHILNTPDSCQSLEPNKSSSPYNSKFSLVSDDTIKSQHNLRQNDYSSSKNMSAKTTLHKDLASTEDAEKAHLNWHSELRKCREKELKFTEAGWKRDCHGKWYRDENVEFDSDEEDPNDSLK